jgi:hypothetical protein
MLSLLECEPVFLLAGAQCETSQRHRELLFVKDRQPYRQVPERH